MKRYLFLFFAIMTAFVLLLAGCADSSSNSGNTTSQGSQTAESVGQDSLQNEDSSSAPSSGSVDAGISGNAAPVVYFTDHISAEGMMAVYEALGWTPTGRVAVKLSTGEPPF